jgi:hypothetical protein
VHLVTNCKAASDYTLWLRFDDGLQGNVYLGNLLDIGCFKLWRDVRVFLTACVDSETGTVIWPAARVRLDPEILWRDLAAREKTEGSSQSKIEPVKKDAAFERFMVRVLERAPRHRKKGN